MQELCQEQLQNSKMFYQWKSAKENSSLSSLIVIFTFSLTNLIVERAWPGPGPGGTKLLSVAVGD